jgi:hypothetical protein
VQLTPRRLGFWPFPNKENSDGVRWFGEIVGWHREKIKEACEWTTGILSQLPVE